MTDPLTPAQQLVEYLYQNSRTQPIATQQPTTADVERFNRMLAAEERRSESIGIETTSSSLTAHQGVDAGNFSDKVFNAISELDNDYRSTIGRLQDWPSFGAYLQREGVSMDQQRISSSESINHVSNIDEVQTSDTATTAKASLQTGIDKLAEYQQTQHAFYNAGMDYQYDSTRWFLSAEFWMTKVKVLTSAVSQVSNSVRTLFSSQ